MVTVDSSDEIVIKEYKKDDPSQRFSFDYATQTIRSVAKDTHAISYKEENLKLEEVGAEGYTQKFHYFFQ